MGDRLPTATNPDSRPERSAELAPDTTRRLALRPKEAAKALGIGERLLWSLTNRGEIPHLKVGKAVLYPIADLEGWLSDQTHKKGGHRR